MSKKRTKDSMSSNTVTILTVKQRYRSGEISKLTLAFASRAQALGAIDAHTNNADAITTIRIRTLRVLADA